MRKVPLLLFIVLLVHGSLLGLSDDEAYYWVLAQKLSFGYAYHPPGVAGFIAFFQYLLGGIFGTHSAGLVRLPAALSSAMIFILSLSWLKDLGLLVKNELKVSALLLSFFGFFALSWMMVPDIPLFLGWTLLFTQCWKICFGKPTFWTQAGFFVGAALVLLAKYSGILAVFSAFLALCIWMPRRKFRTQLGILGLGACVGILPSLIWNYSHEWASLLYQIRNRHEGSSISFLRYVRFWLIECVLAGPWAIAYFFHVGAQIFKKKSAIELSQAGFPLSMSAPLNGYFLVWILPAAAVFCIQPLFSDFKPHWAFIVWWPVFLAFAHALNQSKWKFAAQCQSFYGLTLGALVLLGCHFPIGTWVAQQLSQGQSTMDPRLDVTNDFYRWQGLEDHLRSRLGKQYMGLPVIGSRYQTAAQAKFSLAGMNATLLPRDLKERDEWPDLGVSVLQGPDWPRLQTEVLFVADNRYDAGPQFPFSHCEKVTRFETRRFQLLAGWIDVWHCIAEKL